MTEPQEKLEDKPEEKANSEAKDEDDEPKEPRNPKPKGFWQHLLEYWRALPGVLKALALLIGAVSGFYAVLHKAPETPSAKVGEAAASAATDSACLKPIEERPFSCRQKE